MLRAVRVMMMFENVNEGRHEVPGDGHGATDFAVVHTKIVTLDGRVVGPIGRRRRAFLDLLLGRNNPQGKLPDIMK